MHAIDDPTQVANISAPPVEQPRLDEHGLLWVGRRWVVIPDAQVPVVRLLLDQHVKKAEARALYDDVTPKPSPEEVEMRRIERAYRAATRAAGTPDRRQRRALRRMKEGE